MRLSTTSLLSLFACALLALTTVAAQDGPHFSAAGPDAAAYGQVDGYPIGTAATLDQQRFLVGAFSHFDRLFPHHDIAAAPSAWAFTRAPEQAIRYRHAGETHTLDDYMTRLPVTGLLIAKDGTILTERYQYGRTDQDRFTSQSMAKTIVGVLVGLAIADGRIASVTDRAGAYVPGLGESPYGQTTIRDLLHMSSGVTCPSTSAFSFARPGALGAAALARCSRAAPAGTTFAYSNLDTTVLGLVARRAFGRPLADVVHDRLWAPMGAEAGASWTVDGDGEEVAFCCLNATLRDFARLGRLLANDGTRDGRAIIPRGWLVDASSMSASDPQLEPGKPAPFFGYGYQVWILPDERRMFCLLGANGQRIFVDPLGKLVMVQTAVETQEVDRTLDAETIGLWLSLIAQFGR